MFTDSLDKIIGVYLAGVCRKPFAYKGQAHVPRPLKVSPLIFRGFTCPERCGGCCPRFTLDYIPSEPRPYVLNQRSVRVDGKDFTVFSDMQEDNHDHHCHNLDKATGRCNIHGRHPFSCDFELIRFISYEDRTVQTQKLFGRGWAMLRVDQERGARCEMLPPTADTVSEVVRKLGRLREWADYFEIDTHLPAIIDWARAGPRNDALNCTVEGVHVACGADSTG